MFLSEKSNEFVRTDLACENDAMSKVGAGGGKYKEEISDEGFLLIRAAIESKEEAKKAGKPQGNYLTVVSGKIAELGEGEAAALSRCLARELRDFVCRACEKSDANELCVLIAGLGNSRMTPDAIGPEAVARMTVTNHISYIDPQFFESLGCSRVCAVVPGVLGDTGIESVDLIKGAIKGSGADAAVIIDALASRSAERLASTFQMSDSGITPGAGVGNRRSEISRRTLGVPVIALGVPTVIDAATLVFDALEKFGKSADESALALLREQKNFFVAPKESDEITRRAACIIADAVDIAFGIKREP